MTLSGSRAKNGLKIESFKQERDKVGCVGTVPGGREVGSRSEDPGDSVRRNAGSDWGRARPSPSSSGGQEREGQNPCHRRRVSLLRDEHEQAIPEAPSFQP